MNSPWLIIIAGIIFCLTGVYLFQKNAFETEKSIVLPLIIILTGKVLVGVGMAKKLTLIH